MGSAGRVQPRNPSSWCAPRCASSYLHSPGPARLAASRPPPGLPGLSTLPHSSSARPQGRPSLGTPLLSLCRPLPLGSPPSRKPPPLPSRSPSLLRRVLKPLPLLAARIRQIAPSWICGALDPKARPWSSPRKAWPSPASGSAFPIWIWVPAPQEPPSSHSQPSDPLDPPGSCGHPLTGSRFPPFPGPRALSSLFKVSPLPGLAPIFQGALSLDSQSGAPLPTDPLYPL